MRAHARWWPLVLPLLLAGCASKHPPVATAPPSAKPSKQAGEPEPERPSVAPGGAQAKPGYEKRVESLAGLDTSPLRGRRIALDPGHGGRFPGLDRRQRADRGRGQLGVALNLWGFLVNAGGRDDDPHRRHRLRDGRRLSRCAAT
jgi:hypothetical protein